MTTVKQSRSANELSKVREKIQEIEDKALVVCHNYFDS